MGCSKEEGTGQVGVSRAAGETEAKRQRLDGSVTNDALPAASLKTTRGHHRSNPLMYVFGCFFHRCVEAVVGSRVQPGLETAGVSAFKLGSLL